MERVYPPPSATKKSTPSDEEARGIQKGSPQGTEKNQGQILQKEVETTNTQTSTQTHKTVEKPATIKSSLPIKSKGTKLKAGFFNTKKASTSGTTKAKA